MEYGVDFMWALDVLFSSPVASYLSTQDAEDNQSSSAKEPHYTFRLIIMILIPFEKPLANTFQ